jgi:hypothetical protein
MNRFPPNVDKLTNSDYTNRMRSGAIKYPGMAVHWYRQVVTLDDFDGAAATSQALALNTLFPNNVFPKHVLQMPGAMVRLLEVYAGPSVTEATAVLGITGTTNGFLTSTNIFTGADLGVKQTPAASLYGGRFQAELSPLLTLATVGANISVLTTGALEVLIPFTPAAHF